MLYSAGKAGVASPPDARDADGISSRLGAGHSWTYEEQELRTESELAVFTRPLYSNVEDDPPKLACPL